LSALAIWLAVFLAFAPLEVTGLATLKPADARAYGDAATRLRSIASIGAHYLWMAATGSGTSAFHEPLPVRSWLDGGGLAGRARGLRAGDEEAAWWIAAAAAFAPVSQVAPFFFPMADRYLYFMLPGLIGGSLLAGRAALARAGARRVPWGRAAFAAGAVAVA